MNAQTYPAAPNPSGQVPSGQVPSGQAFGAVQQPTAANLRHWLVAQRNAGVTPDRVASQLLANGWDSDSASRAAMSSLRQADYHRLIYSTLCWGAGLSALGAGTAAHLALGLTDGNDHFGARDTIAIMLSLLVVALPLTILALVKSREIERTDKFAVWSPTRRFLFGLLGGCVGVVGIVRALTYVYELIAAAIGATGQTASAASVLQILVTLVIATPIVWWSVTEWTRSNVARRSLREPRPADTLEAQ